MLWQGGGPLTCAGPSPQLPHQEVCSVPPDRGSALESLCWVMGSQGAAWDRWVWMDTPGGSPGELGYQRKPSREGYGAKEGKPRVQCTQLMLLRLGSVTLPLAVGIRARPCKSHMAHSSCQA